MSEMSYSLLCFNIDNKDLSDITRHLGQFDLYFIQEIRKNKCTNTELHNVIYLMEKEIGSSLCNCLYYNKDKFDLLKIDGKDCRLDDTSEFIPDIYTQII